MEKPASWIAEWKALTALSFITFILAVLPIPTFIKSRNIGCLLYSFWIAVLCFSTFVNNIIWRDNVRNNAPIWCDIYARLTFMGSLGILSAGLVIARRVSLIANVSTTWLRSQSRARAMFIDFAIGLSPPIAVLLEFWFMQIGRFDILEDLGCFYNIPFNVLSICLYWIWHFVIGLLSAFYCVRTLHAVFRRHRHIRQVLLMSRSSMNPHLFYRLAACAIIESCCTLPLVVFGLIRAIPAYTPWEGLVKLHSGISEIRQFSYGTWSSSGPAQVTEWYQIGCGIIFFLLLGLNRDARSRYKQWLGLSTIFPDKTELEAPVLDSHFTSFVTDTVEVHIPPHPETIQVIA